MPTVRVKSIALCALWCFILVTKGHALAINSEIAEAVQVPKVTRMNDKQNTPGAVYVNKDTTQISTTQISWLEQWQLLRKEMQDCVKLTKDTSWNCFKVSSLRIFDDFMQAPIIPLWHGIRFVQQSEGMGAPNQALIAANDAALLSDVSKKPTNIWKRQDFKHLTWFDRLALRLAKMFSTHLLQINLKQMTDAYMQMLERKENSTKLQQHLDDTVGTARHRHHRYNMMITMMFGATALGAIMVPLGFQLLSIVSGKALLLAKMALLLASINGLKRVANSGIHYGLYHVPGEHLGGYYDRGDVHHPRNVASIAVTQPIEMGIRK